MAQSCFVCFLLALLSSVCFSFIVYIVTYVDIGGQHWWSWYSLWQLAMIVLFTVSYYCFYCFIILANKFFFLSLIASTRLTSSPHFLTSVKTRLASLASPRLADSSRFIAFASSRCLTSLFSLCARLAEDSLASPHPRLIPHCVLVSDWLMVPSPSSLKTYNTGTSRHSCVVK